jgi:hypothetical protein
MFDDSIHAMALQQYVINWSRAAEVVNLEGMVESLTHREEPEEDDDKNEDEGEKGF